jgi:hypothetical protein
VASRTMAATERKRPARGIASIAAATPAIAKSQCATRFGKRALINTPCARLSESKLMPDELLTLSSRKDMVGRCSLELIPCAGGI